MYEKSASDELMKKIVQNVAELIFGQNDNLTFPWKKVVQVCGLIVQFSKNCPK
jgi:hypothetical protein